MKAMKLSSALLLVALSGCAAIPGLGPAPVDAFDITAPHEFNVKRKLSRSQILIPEPSAIKILDGEDIVIRPGSGTVQLLGSARWTDRLPKLVQARLIEAFQSSNSVGGVGKPGEGLAIDYQVIVDIRAFEVRIVQGGAIAYMDLYVRILNDRNGMVRASRNFAATAPVISKGAASFVSALDQAFHKSVTDIVNWSVSAI